ncbi:glycosyltransferase [Methylosinus trichosporium]|uniref:glycosyltransferase n=1 Tax=Methylosinus TaxID=425 RepID=UPI00046381CB|nr:glycosyltransferase [Methylosinus trichosporium]OBS53882.1 hypothetical protein A8B73_03700 [Methylosinus sp. 3S-1]
MRRLGVLHVIPSVSLREGGPARALATMERALDEAGVRVTTVATSHGLGDAAPARARRIYSKLWASPYKFAPGLAPTLAAAIRSHDVVHIHALFSFSSTLAAWIARLYGVPYVVRPLGVLNAWGVGERRARLKRLSIALVERSNLRAAAAVHFTSEQEKEEAERLGLAFRSVVIPLGVEAPEQSGDATRQLLPAALAGRMAILFLSRVSPKKNLETLIDAFALSPVLRKSAALVVAGEGEADYVERLRARARVAGVGEAVCWLGHVDGAQKALALRSADVFVLPSFSENFGIAAVEAMQAGLPCVLTPGVAVAASAEGAGAAIIVEPEATALRVALERLIGDGEARRRMSVRAREFSHEAWSTETMAARLVDLYETVARGRSSGE